MNIFANKTISNIVNNNSVRKFASQMCNHKAFLPVIMLESTVISGRCYQAYKRGGKTELRERMIDETITAAIWFGIIEALNKVFNCLIKQKGIFHKNGLPEIEIDLGKDAIRNPIQHAIEAKPEIKNIIGGLKLTKIAVAALSGIYLSGVVLPKFYQNLTKKILSKDKQDKLKQNDNILNNTKVTFDEFLNKISPNKQISFGHGALQNVSTHINAFANLLENNPIAKLLTIDAGLFTGRIKNARNKDESIEFGFRDITSSFFYLFSTPLIYKTLSKYVDKFGGKNTNLDPNTVDFVTNAINKQMNGNVDLATFKQQVLGAENIEFVAKVLNEIKSKTIDISEFDKILSAQTADKQFIDTTMQKANEFIKLRPTGASTNLLTLSEVKNCLNNGYINNPEFLTNAVEVATQGVSQAPKKFISFKEIDKIKVNIQNYVESIADYAKSIGQTQITPSLLQQVKNRNLLVKTGYTALGMSVSALFLSTLIPKLQYKITEWRTGKKDFPGIRDLK